MSVAIIVDEFECVGTLVKKFLSRPKEVSKEFGFDGFTGFYKSKKIYVFYSKLKSRSFWLQLEGLISSEKIDHFILVEKLFVIKESKLSLGSYSFVKTSVFKSKNLIFKEVDSDSESDLMMAAEDLGLFVSKTTCYCIVSSDYSESFINHDSFECFDFISYSIMELSSRYGKKSIVLGLNLPFNYFDVHHYLIEKKSYHYESLFKLSLELAIRWS